MSEKEARTWKAAAYDAMILALKGAKVSEASDFMLGARCKILVFKDNSAAEEFERLIRRA